MARSLGGTDSDKIDCGSSSLLNPTTAMTFVCWAYAVTFPHAYNVICKRVNTPTGTKYYAFQPKSTGKLALYYVAADHNATSYDGTGSNTLSTGTWYSLGFVIPSGATNVQGKGYVNGTLDGSTGNVGGGVDIITGTTTIGWDASAANSGWNGRIADSAIYDVALTVDELLAFYRGARPYQIRPANLKGYWPLDGLSSPEPDYSGNKLNATLTGTALANGPPMTMFTPRWPRNIDVAAPTLSQKHFRFRTDAGAVDATPTWGANEDAA